MGKIKQSRLKKVVVATGGGFDPLHKGHIRLLKEAKKIRRCFSSNAK